MKKQFLFITGNGNWGKGDTIPIAIKNSHGISRCKAILYVCFLEENATISCNDYGCFCWTGTVHYHKIFFNNGKLCKEQE